jgi:hypothetical protein
MIQVYATYSGGIVHSPSGYRRVLNIRLGTVHWKAYTVEGCHPDNLQNNGKIIVRRVRSRRGELRQVQVDGVWYKLVPLLSTNQAA